VCCRNISGGIVSPGLELTDLSIIDIKRMIPDQIAKNITYINYCGTVGDPCMAPDLLPILQYFSKASPNVIQYVRTNGGMRNVDFWIELGNFFSRSSTNQNFGNVVFSVDGLEDTNHIYRRGVKWEKLIAHMRAYSSTGAIATWEWLLFEHNQHQLVEAKALAKELNFKFVIKNPLGFTKTNDKVTGIPVYNKEGEFEYDIWPANYSNIKEGPLLGNKVNFDNLNNINVIPIIDELSRNLEKNSNISCKSLPLNGSQEIYISANKYMLPCCFMGGVFGQFGASYSRYQLNKMINDYGLDVFSLHNQSVLDILQNSKFSKFFFDGWKADTIENGKLLYCVETCGDNSAIDNIYNNLPK
jgi:MoaA/NifB/PqqE/SkfB family radical SAM enzyme